MADRPDVERILDPEFVKYDSSYRAKQAVVLAVYITELEKRLRAMEPGCKRDSDVPGRMRTSGLLGKERNG